MQCVEPAQHPYSRSGTPPMADACWIFAGLATKGDVIFTGLATEGHEPPKACVGASQWHAATTVNEVLTAAGTVLRGADPIRRLSGHARRRRGWGEPRRRGGRLS